MPACRSSSSQDEAAVCYASHVAAAPSPFTFRTVDVAGERLQIRLATSDTGYWGVSLASARSNYAKPYVARLGPSGSDFIGYYSTPFDAAVAVARAVRVRDELVSSLGCDARFDEDVLSALICNDSNGNAAEPSDAAVALAPALGLGGAVTGPMHYHSTAGASSGID